MRLIPRGKPLYENLPTVFLNWEEMSSKLRTDKFSGYIMVNSDPKTGIILFVEGRISGSLFSSSGAPAIRGQEALSKSIAAIQERKGSLSIYSTSIDICSLVEWFIEGISAYSPMESYFIDYDKFLTVLGEKGFTGLIKVTNEDFAELIYISDGKVKGHFIDCEPELKEDPGILKDKLILKGTLLEVFSKTDNSKSIKLESPPPTASTPIKVEVPQPVIEPPKPVTPITPRVEPAKSEPVKPIEPIKPEPIKTEPKFEPFKPDPKLSEPPKPAQPISVQPKPGSRPVINIPEDEIPDPFAMRKPVEEKKPTPPTPTQPPVKETPPAPPPVQPKEPPTASFGPGGATTVSPPSGKVAFLIDGIRKVAQSNIGEDMLPWLDGQISRMKAINPTFSKRDLMLLVDEIERYVRTVRQNPTKASKLSSQLRHIIESFASDLE